MWKWSLLALGLGLLFAVLAWSGLRRRSSWRDGEKLWGQVAGVSVTPAWNGADSMDGDRSPARVTLRLSLEGREVSLQKDFPKVLAAPALGQRVRVLYLNAFEIAPLGQRNPQIVQVPSHPVAHSATPFTPFRTRSSDTYIAHSHGTVRPVPAV